MILEEKDLRDLKKAANLLTQDTITDRMTRYIGAPIDYLMSKLPEGAKEEVHGIVSKALHKAADTALWTLDNEPDREASTVTNKILAAASGAVGGAFGFSALAIELPVSTTIMLRSVADIARSEGFDLSSLETKQACLEVFALGGPTQSDDAVDTAYYAARSFTAEAVQAASKELAEIAAKQASAEALKKVTPTQAGKWIAVFIEKIATRFGIVITEKAAAQFAPVIGAITGAALNAMFTDYYQDMARGHFIIKRLEQKYGEDRIKYEYESIVKPKAA